jgi:hypothetical protein
MSPRAVPPEDAHLVQLEEPCPCSLDTREVKLEQLVSGENPMFMKIKTDELISFSSRRSNPLDLGSVGGLVRRRCCRQALSPKHDAGTHTAGNLAQELGRWDGRGLPAFTRDIGKPHASASTNARPASVDDFVWGSALTGGSLVPG